MKHKRDFKALEKRRLQGAKLLARGVSKSEVARQLGVPRHTATAWEKRLEDGGKEALRRATPGRPRQLSEAQKRELGKLNMAGALAAGYPTELWTLARIGELIAERFEVQSLNFRPTPPNSIRRRRSGPTRTSTRSPICA